MKPMKPMAPMKPIAPFEAVKRILRMDSGTKRGYASCALFSASPMRCPLCGVDVPKATEHTCEKSS